MYRGSESSPRGPQSCGTIIDLEFPFRAFKMDSSRFKQVFAEMFRRRRYLQTNQYCTTKAQISDPLTARRWTKCHTDKTRAPNEVTITQLTDTVGDAHVCNSLKTGNTNRSFTILRSGIEKAVLIVDFGFCHLFSKVSWFYFFGSSANSPASGLSNNERELLLLRTCRDLLTNTRIEWNCILNWS